MIKKILFSLLILITSFIVFQLLNHLIIEKIIIGDPCDYDIEGKETSKLFNLFYTISSDSGYHPEPSILNFCITTTISIIIGLLITYKQLWKPTEKRS
jgi:hypothetical protein